MLLVQNELNLLEVVPSSEGPLTHEGVVPGELLTDFKKFLILDTHTHCVL